MWDQAFHICWACFPLCQEWTLVLFLWDFCKGSGYRTQRGFQMAQWYRLRLPMQETRVWSLGSVPGWAGSSGVWNVNSLQYFCQKNHMDRGAWQATVHRVAKSQTQTMLIPPSLKPVSVGTKTSFASTSKGKSSRSFFKNQLWILLKIFKLCISVVGVLICSDCLNKASQIGGLKNRNVLSHSSGSKIKVLPGLVSGEISLVACRRSPPHCVPRWPFHGARKRRERKIWCFFLLKDTSPIRYLDYFHKHPTSKYGHTGA